MKAQHDLQAIAERILLNQLQLSTIAQAKQMLKSGKLELDKLVPLSAANSTSTEFGADVEEEEGDSKQKKRNRNSEGRDEGHEALEDEKNIDLDASLLEEDEATQFTQKFTAEELRTMNASDSIVSDLPRPTQMVLLSEMKAAHRGHVGNLSLTSPKRMSGHNYSLLQVEQLVHKGGITRRLESVRNELSANVYKPIASDPNVRYRMTSPSATPIKSLLDLDTTLEDASSPSSSGQSVQVTIGSQGSSQRSPYARTSVSRSNPSTSTQFSTTYSGDSSESVDQSFHSILSSPTKLKPLSSAFSIPKSTNSSHNSTIGITKAMVDLDPDMALIELISDEEEEDDAENNIEVESIGDDNDDNVEETLKESTQEERKTTDIGEEILEQTEGVVGVPKNLTSSITEVERVSPNVSIVAIESEPEKDEDDLNFSDIEFEDVEPQSSPQPSELIEASTSNAHIEVSNSKGDEEANEDISPIAEAIIPSPSIDTSPSPRQEDINAERESDIESPGSTQPHHMVGGTIETEAVSPSPDEAPIISETVQNSSENVNIMDLTTDRSIHSEEVRITDLPTPSLSVASSSLIQPSENLLDISTESSKMLPSSLNQSVISEEEMQRVTQMGANFEDLEAELLREVATLEQEARQGQNQTVVLTSEAVDEAKELLKLFGIPFVQSPSEADSQCAALQMLGLVDGIVSDDSDILVFGGDVVFRHAFSSKYDLELYNMEDIRTELGLDHYGLVFLALLLGGDYADGIPKVGPKVASDIVAEFSGPDGMLDFKCWVTAFQEGHENYDRVFAAPSTVFVKKYEKLMKNLKLPSSFPNPSVLAAYQDPSVDPSNEPFSWGIPDLAGLRQFALAKFGWTQDRVDTSLLPIIKQYTTALYDPQQKIETFFTQTSIHGRKATPKQALGEKKKPTAKRATARAKRGASSSVESQSMDIVHAEENDETELKDSPKGSKKRKRLHATPVPSQGGAEIGLDEEYSPKKAKSKKKS